MAMGENSTGMKRKECLINDHNTKDYPQSIQAKHLFLDDKRIPSDVAKYILPLDLRDVYQRGGWIVVRSYKDFMQHISKKGLPDLISFDHDLDNEIKPEKSPCTQTGYDCAKWLIAYIEKHHLSLPLILCHSMNPVGKANIEALFQGYRRYRFKTNK